MKLNVMKYFLATLVVLTSAYTAATPPPLLQTELASSTKLNLCVNSIFQFRQILLSSYFVSFYL